MEQPTAPVAKGKGKGRAPPAPPALKGKSKGKGNGAALMLPTAKGKGKSKGKGKTGTPVPQELLAPNHAQRLRVDHADFKAGGTIWEGFAPFGVVQGTLDNCGPLQGTEIDVDLLRSFWAPRLTISPTPVIVAEPEQRSVLTDHITLNIQVAARANALTPDLVRRALTEDWDLLSAEQGIALAKNIAPLADQIEGVLLAEVARRGSADLSLPEALLWEIIRVPRGAMRAQVLAECCGLEEELKDMQEHLEKVDDLVLRLRNSRPLKTVLQIALAIRNIMSQHGSEGMECKRLASFKFQKVGHGYQNGVPPTSVLELIVRMTEASHARRARLRPHRMMAVGRLAPDDDSKRLVWSFLDDLTSSPWDCLPLLADCSGHLVSPEMVSEMRVRGRNLHFMANSQFATVTNAAAVDSGTTEAWRYQLAAARKSVEEAAGILDHSLLRLNAAAKDVNQLFGEAHRRGRAGAPLEGHIYETAQTVLCHLQALGQDLTTEHHRQELERIRAAKVRSLGDDIGRRQARVWPPVDTTMTTLHATSDTDLLRTLGLLMPCRNNPVGTHEGPEGVYERNPATGQWTLQRHGARAQAGPAGADLLHGGADGAYQHDPITGRWVNLLHT